MVRVGVCEDDPRVREVLRDVLRRAGHEVLLAHDGGEALRAFAAPGSVDVLILDIGLPDADGRDVCQALRTAGQHAPALFLTARDSLTDLVSAFSAGGDDYLTKPFAIAELTVRVAALAQRHVPASQPTGLVLDPATFSARVGTRAVTLTPTEYRLLAALTARPGVVLRRQELTAAAWPLGAVVHQNTLDSFVRRVRTKLEALDPPVAVHTVRGVGYVLR